MFKPKTRKQFAKIWRDFYNETLKESQALHDQHKKGKIGEEAFSNHCTVYSGMLNIAEDAIYMILHESVREFSRLVRLRKEIGLTQREAAVKAGVSVSLYAALEQGFEETIKKKSKQKVANMLNVSYDALFFNSPLYWKGKTEGEIDKSWEKAGEKALSNASPEFLKIVENRKKEEKAKR